jgi:hypothetical protein
MMKKFKELYRETSSTRQRAPQSSSSGLSKSRENSKNSHTPTSGPKSMQVNLSDLKNFTVQTQNLNTFKVIELNNETPNYERKGHHGHTYSQKFISNNNQGCYHSTSKNDRETVQTATNSNINQSSSKSPMSRPLSNQTNLMLNTFYTSQRHNSSKPERNEKLEKSQSRGDRSKVEKQENIEDSIQKRYHHEKSKSSAQNIFSKEIMSGSKSNVSNNNSMIGHSHAITTSTISKNLSNNNSNTNSNNTSSLCNGQNNSQISLSNNNFNNNNNKSREISEANRASFVNFINLKNVKMPNRPNTAYEPMPGNKLKNFFLLYPTLFSIFK